MAKQEMLRWWGCVFLTRKNEEEGGEKVMRREEKGRRELEDQEERRGEEREGKASSDFLDFKGFQATIHQHLAKVDR